MISLCFKSLNKKTIVNLSTRLAESNFKNLIYTQKKFKHYYNLIIHYIGSSPQDFYNYVSNFLGVFIIDNYENKILKSQLEQDFFYFSDFELNDIYNTVLKNITKKNAIQKKKDVLLKELLTYIKDRKALYVEGIVNFRAYKYRALLNEYLEDSVHKYVIHKEYSEYIDLLKNYIDEKPSQTSLIHLIYFPTEKALIDKDLNIITTTSEKKYLSDISFSENDFILNSILSTMPEKIIIHTNSPNDNFIQFLLSIFGERSELCSENSLMTITNNNCSFNH